MVPWGILTARLHGAKALLINSAWKQGVRLFLQCLQQWCILKPAEKLPCVPYWRWQCSDSGPGHLLQWPVLHDRGDISILPLTIQTLDTEITYKQGQSQYKNFLLKNLGLIFESMVCTHFIRTQSKYNKIYIKMVSITSIETKLVQGKA